MSEWKFQLGLIMTILAKAVASVLKKMARWGYCAQFERKFSSFINHKLVCLFQVQQRDFILLMAAGISRGDEVIIQD